ncbi:hypothetical protein E4665_07460 [Sporolactobacillus shoreae]|uniref:RadC-like JAB domain-containing protein n=2 Tax=Sporolactobacillus shoreae TaxID=1465501 RepID=A0A4Z0GP71_9BACL|nr:hypothetical protein E4665_07460 [Sporolactobacillus shoreae]
MKHAKGAKRISVISLRVVKEKNMLYSNRFIRSPEDGYQCIKPLLECRDREYFVVVTLDTKNQPTSINICHIGNLNSSIVHPREVNSYRNLKPQDYKSETVGYPDHTILTATIEFDDDNEIEEK